MPNAIAKRIEIFVRCVLAKFKLVLAHVIVDVFSPDAKKRPQDCQLNITDAASRDFPHRSETSAAGATKQIDQESFD